MIVASSAAASSSSSTRAGTVVHPASFAARRRLAPAMSTYPSPLGRTSSGCSTPCRRTLAVRSSSPASVNDRRGLVGDS